MFADTRSIAVVGLVVLGGFLAFAVWHDVRTYRIPNRVTVVGAALALALHALLPGGSGFVGTSPGEIGLLAALAGLLAGLGALMPLYALRAVGAGDVKLMGMVGAFLGPVDVLGALVATAIAGAVLALVYALRAQALRRMTANLGLIFCSLLARQAAAPGPSFDPRHDSAANVPYSIAIAGGTAAWTAMRQLA